MNLYSWIKGRWKWQLMVILYKLPCFKLLNSLFLLSARSSAVKKKEWSWRRVGFVFCCLWFASRGALAHGRSNKRNFISFNLRVCWLWAQSASKQAKTTTLLLFNYELNWCVALSSPGAEWSRKQGRQRNSLKWKELSEFFRGRGPAAITHSNWIV